MLEPSAATPSSSTAQLVIWAIVILLASNTTSIFVTNWFNRKRQPLENDQTEAGTDLAKVQSTHNLAETLKLVSDQLLETTTALKDAARRISADEVEKEMLSKQVERARREGFLQRDDQSGAGPNPAA